MKTVLRIALTLAVTLSAWACSSVTEPRALAPDSPHFPAIVTRATAIVPKPMIETIPLSWIQDHAR